MSLTFPIGFKDILRAKQKVRKDVLQVSVSIGTDGIYIFADPDKQVNLIGCLVNQDGKLIFTAYGCNVQTNNQEMTEVALHGGVPGTAR